MDIVLRTLHLFGPSFAFRAAARHRGKKERIGLEPRVLGLWCLEHVLKPGADDGKLGTKKRGSLFIFPNHLKFPCFSVRAANKLDPDIAAFSFQSRWASSFWCMNSLASNKAK